MSCKTPNYIELLPTIGKVKDYLSAAHLEIAKEAYSSGVFRLFKNKLYTYKNKYAEAANWVGKYNAKQKAIYGIKDKIISLKKNPNNIDGTEVLSIDASVLDTYYKKVVESQELLDSVSEGIARGEDVNFWKGQQQKESNYDFESLEVMSKKILRLKKNFNVEVVLDSDMKELGRVDPYEPGEIPTVRLNPRLLGSDTVIHEFGHVYINLLGGSSNRFIAEGITQLKDSDLWRNTADLYPELTLDQLDMEVLATAIGIEGSKIFKEFNVIEKFNNWLNSFFEKLKALIGIPQNRAKQLAKEMFGENIRTGGSPIGINYSQLQKTNNKEDTTERLKSINSAFSSAEDNTLIKDGIPYKSTKTIIKEDFKKNTLESLHGKRQVLNIMSLVNKGYTLDQIKKENINKENFIFDNTLQQEPYLSQLYDYSKKLLDKFKEEGKEVIINSTVSDDRVGVTIASTIDFMTVSQSGKIELFTPFVTKSITENTSETIVAEQSLQSEILRNMGIQVQGMYSLPITVDTNFIFRNYKENTINKEVIKKYLGTVLSQTTLDKIDATAKVLVGTLQRKINILASTIEDKSPAQRANYDKFKQLVTDLADAKNSEVISSFVKVAARETTALYERLSNTVNKDNYTIEDLRLIYDYSQSYNSIDEITNLLRDFSVIEELQEESFKDQVNLIKNNIDNISAAYKENVKKAFARKYVKESKIFSARRIELEREFNVLEIKKYKDLKPSVIKDKKKEYINKKIAEEYDTLIKEEETRLIRLLGETDVDVGALDLWVTDPRNQNDELMQLIEEKLSTVDYIVSASVQQAYLEIDDSLTKLIELKGNTSDMPKLYEESLESYNGKLTGYYVSEYYSTYDAEKKIVWGEYYDIADKDSPEALIAYKKAIKWNKENIQGKYIESFQKKIDLFASEDNTNSGYKINQILAKYTDKSNVSEKDLDIIKKILKDKESTPKEKNKEKAKFYKDEVEFIENEAFIEAQERKKKQLTEEAYNKWYKAQYYESSHGEKLLSMWSMLKPKDSSVMNEFVGLPVNKWKNPQFSKLEELRKNKSPIAEVYDKFIEKNKLSDSYVPTAQKLGYRLPAVEKSTVERISDKGAWNALKIGFNNLFVRTNLDTDLGEDKGEAPKKGIESLKHTLKETLNVFTKEDGREKKSIALFYRKELANKEDQSYDLATLCLANFQTCKNYSEKTKVAVDIEVAKDLIYERQVNQYTPDGKLKVDAFTGKAVKNVDSNTYKSLLSLMDTRLYGIRMLGDASFNKKASQLNAWASNTVMMLNFLSAPANLLHGKVTNLIEGFGGQYYNSTNLKNAEVEYAKDSKNLLSDIGRRVQLSKTNVLLRTFNVLDSFDATHNRFAENTKTSNLAKTNSLYAPQKAGEHMIQSTVMYAYLDTVKIKNKEGVELKYTDAVEIKNGRAIAKPGYEEATTTEFQSNIASSLARILSHQFGNYSSHNVALLQRYASGNMVVSLKKFLVGGAKRRYRGIGDWKNRIGEDNYNTQHFDPVLGHYVEGDYVTTFRALRTMYQDYKTLKLQTIGHTWESMTDIEKARFKRTTLELGIALTAFALSILIKGEDDDKEEGTGQLMAMFLTRRLYSELSFWVNPIEQARTLRSPAQSLSFLEKIFRLIGQLGSPLEEYTKGERKGQLKLRKKTSDIIPIWSQGEKSLNNTVNFLYDSR